eukprot:PhF_6_TR21080/c0_g1_i1/m.30384
MELDDQAIDTASHEDLVAHIRLQRVLVRHLYARVLELEKQVSLKSLTPTQLAMSSTANPTTGVTPVNSTHISLLKQAHRLIGLQRELKNASHSEAAAHMQQQIGELIAQALEAVVENPTANSPGAGGALNGFPKSFGTPTPMSGGGVSPRTGGAGHHMSSDYPYTPMGMSRATTPRGVGGAPVDAGVGITPRGGVLSSVTEIQNNQMNHNAAVAHQQQPFPTAQPSNYYVTADDVDRDVLAFKERVQGVLRNRDSVQQRAYTSAPGPTTLTSLQIPNPPTQPPPHHYEDDRMSFHTADDNTTVMTQEMSQQQHSQPNTPRRHTATAPTTNHNHNPARLNNNTNTYASGSTTPRTSNSTPRGHQSNNNNNTNNNSVLPASATFKPLRVPSPERSKWAKPEAVRIAVHTEPPQPAGPPPPPTNISDRLMDRVHHLQSVHSKDCASNVNLELKEWATEKQMQRLERFKHRREMYMLQNQ